jgi:mannose-6-phosphate isomerase-like protein (cupin superfamily)
VNVKEYIESGILEMYVLGQLGEREAREVLQNAEKYGEIREEIENISESLMKYGEAQPVKMDPTARPMLLATIDYTQRLKSGEPVSFPPLLNNNSKPLDYAQWLNRKDMFQPADADNIFLKIIGYTPEATTAIVWVKEYTPSEVHHDEYERFLIVEGTCDISIEGKVNKLVPGDYLEIPLHAEHNVKITSSIPCKILLQRVAA